MIDSWTEGVYQKEEKNVMGTWKRKDRQERLKDKNRRKREREDRRRTSRATRGGMGIRIQEEKNKT